MLGDCNDQTISQKDINNEMEAMSIDIEMVSGALSQKTSICYFTHKKSLLMTLNSLHPHSASFVFKTCRERQQDTAV